MSGSDVEDNSLKAESSNHSVTIPDSLKCTLTHEIFADPVRVKTKDGNEHIYEREAIEEWLQSNNTSPKTNEEVKNKKTKSDQNKQQAVNEFLAQNPSLWNTDVYMPKAWQHAIVNALKPLNRDSINTYLTNHPGMLFAQYEKYQNKTLIQIAFDQGAGDAFTWLAQKWHDRDINYVKNFIDNYKQHHNGDKFFETMILEENMSKSLLDALFAYHQYEGKQLGDTLLHFAVRTNNALFARELVHDFKYDPNQSNDSGQSANEIARQSGKSTLENALKQKKKGKAKMSEGGSTGENGVHDDSVRQPLYPNPAPSAPPEPASEAGHPVAFPRESQRPTTPSRTKPQLSDLHHLAWTLWQDPDANAPLAHAINWAGQPKTTSLLNRQKNSESVEKSMNVYTTEHSKDINLQLPNGATLFSDSSPFNRSLIYTTNEKQKIKLMSGLYGSLYWSQKWPNILLFVKGSNIYFWNLNQQPTKSSSRFDETWQLDPQYQVTVHQIRSITELLTSKIVPYQCYIIAEDKKTLHFVDLRNNANNQPFIQRASAITSMVELPDNHIAVGFGTQITIYDHNRNVVKNLEAKASNFKLDVDNQGQLKITYKNNDVDVYTFPYEPQPAILDTRSCFQNALVRVTQNDNCVSIDIPVPAAETSSQEEIAFDELSRWYNAIISHYDTENWLERCYCIDPLVKSEHMWVLKITAPSAEHAELIANLARGIVLPRDFSNQPHLNKVESEGGASSSTALQNTQAIRHDMLPETSDTHTDLQESIRLFTLARRTNLNIFHVLAKDVETFLQYFTMQSFDYLLDADNNGIMPLHRLMAQITVQQLQRLGAEFCREPRLINHFWAQKDHFGFTPIDCIVLFNPHPVEVLNALFHHLTTAMVYKTTQDRQFVQLPGLTWNDRSALVPIESAYGYKLHSRFRGANTWHDLLRFNSRLWKKTETASSSAFNRMFSKDPRDIESTRLTEMVNAHLAWVLWFQNRIKVASNYCDSSNQPFLAAPAEFILNITITGSRAKLPETHFTYVTKEFLRNKWTTDFPALQKPLSEIYNNEYGGSRYLDFLTNTLNTFVISVLQSDQAEESKKQQPDSHGEGPSS